MRTIALGRDQFLEIPGETLRDAACAAVLAIRDRTPGGVFDVTAWAIRGPGVLTPGEDEAWIAAGVAAAYEELEATSSVVGPSRHPSGEAALLRQPTLLEIRQATSGDPRRYQITLLLTSDGTPRGRLFQETKATLTPAAWTEFLRGQVLPCLVDLPRPFRVALAVGGTSAEAGLAAARRADGGELDHLPDVGGEEGSSLRLPDQESELGDLIEEAFGGRETDRACSQVRIIRLVRHGGSLPVGLYVGLPTDRHVRVTLTSRGVDVSRDPNDPRWEHSGPS